MKKDTFDYVKRVTVYFLWVAVFVAVFFALSTLAGCAAGIREVKSLITNEMRPNQGFAAHTVWSTYEKLTDGRHNAKPQPRVFWVSGDALNCPDGDHDAYIVPSGMVGSIVISVCVYGHYNPITHVATVAWSNNHDKTQPVKFSNTAFAHELCHAYYHDKNHEVCKEEPGSPIEAANKALVEQGF